MPDSQQMQSIAQQPASSESDHSFTVSAPSINLPKGGGAIKGIGEKFTANPVTGTGSMSVPIATSPGRSGFGPQLSLSYDSGAGNGPFGLGWHLSLPSITRKTDKGIPRYLDAEESDVFILSGAEDLVPEFEKDAGGDWVLRDGKQVVHDKPRTVDGKRYRVRRYRPRIEGLFARIERWSNQGDPEDVFWRSISKDNITTWYGRHPESRIFDPADPSRIFSWLICESHDDKGNVISYGYKEENSVAVNLSETHERNRTDESRSANRYLKRIRYGNHVPYFPVLDTAQPWPVPAGVDAADASANWHFEVIFDYGEHDTDVPIPAAAGEWPRRNDSFSFYRSGFEVRTYRLCQRVLMFHHFPGEADVDSDCLVRSTDFDYSYEQDRTSAKNSIYSKIVAVVQSGYKRDGTGGYLKKSLPPLGFEYSRAEVDESVHEVEPESLENLPEGLDGARYQWVDLDGEGLSGILTEQAGSWFYKRNVSALPVEEADGSYAVKARFEPVTRPLTIPSLAMSGGQHRFLDLAGDGQLDVVLLEKPVQGFYERTDDEEWESFRAFESIPNIDWRDPNLKFVDLNGDGHADVLITESEVFTWYPSLAEEGFGAAEKTFQPLDEEHGPRLVFADGTDSIYLADLSGDGLSDLARIRNGEVCYWPNLGYGRFGAKVTMDHAPWFDAPDRFDQKRIRLADIDGSGTTDIIYLHGDGVHLYFNQSGNSWSLSHPLNSFPRLDNLSSVLVADLLGNGTACLVWSSPLPDNANSPMRYIDLMGGQKPHLMLKSRNNLGAETTVTYAPSTKFYLQDRRDGKPWITKIPFPVYVVERVETYDHIRSNRFVSRYSYHHGYYDRAEREFRGFGRVDQIDTEDFEHWIRRDAANAVEADLHQPPVLTKTWFHTGAYLDRERILNQFAHEYYQNGALAEHPLPEPVLPDELTTHEWREALRACKGSVLRSEVYALDDFDEEPHPYVTTRATYRIRQIQPKGSNRHASFLVTPSESISYHYERHPADPRISHSLTLETDEYGNPLKSAAVVYPRQMATPPLPDDLLRKAEFELFHWAEQGRTHIVCSETDYTNDIDSDALTAAYRLRLPCESRSYELTGTPPEPSGFFTPEGLKAALESAAAIPYEAVADGSSQQKRLLKQSRSYFLKNDLSGPLPFGAMGSLGLGHESFRLAFTPALARMIYGAKVAAGDLPAMFTEGCYVHNEGDDNWWVPSGRAVYPADARDHFYLPSGARDPFGYESLVQYDRFDLLAVKTTDAIGNEVLAENDYRVLQAHRITDANGNVSEAAFDSLGLVAGTAVRGKNGEGDSLAGFNADPDQTEIEAFLDDPDPNSPAASALLGSATGRIVYDTGRYKRSGEPVIAAGIVRETHVSGLGPGKSSKLQVNFSYSDGGGNVAMVKVQAEPGLAKRVEEDGTVTEVDTTPRVRWIGNGRTVLNNKGKPVKQYEPYFSVTHAYEDDASVVELGVTPIMHYDPPGRLILTESPDGTFARVELDPWMQKSFDASDTVLESDCTWYADRFSPDPTGPEPTEPDERAAWLAARHADTPAVQHLDSLGRPVLAISDNGVDGKYATRTELDIESNALAVIDARGNRVMQYHYSMLPGGKEKGSPAFYQNGMDGGERWTFADVLGKPMRAWDSRGHLFSTAYDELHRPTGMRVVGGDGTAALNHLYERIEYGDWRGMTADDRIASRANNMIGQVRKHYDQSGLIENVAFDFKGNLVDVQRQLTSDYQAEVVDWAGASPSGGLEEAYTRHTDYDALNRMVVQENWHLAGHAPAIYTPQYSERGSLVGESLSVNGKVKSAIRRIDYDAKGQRQRIDYGNGTITRYDYNPKTFRLKQLRTTRPGYDPPFPGFHSDRANDNVLQQLSYTYDPVGNITEIYDEAYERVFFRNQLVEPRSRYVYDALYRLVQAEGREQYGASGAPAQRSSDAPNVDFPITSATDPNALRNYSQSYSYDEAGNIMQMRHVANGDRWTRNYAYATDSNRLLSTWQGSDTTNAVHYDYDVHGSMLNLSNEPGEEYRMRWDYRDMIRHVDLGGGGQAWYAYDSNKQRTRKRIDRNGATVEERLYLGGMEHYRRWIGGTLVEEIETHHLFAGDQRILIVEDVLDTDSSTLSKGVLDRYQYGNYLGSVGLELDGDASIISYEEYHPYGTTAYQAKNAAVRSTAKRYRYTGMERDEETGLSYHTARYYLPWLGRWISTDTVGNKDGLNLYSYVKARPTLMADYSGNYGEAGHFYTVYFVSLAAGFDQETAFRNAVFAQMPDEVTELSATDQQSRAVASAYGYGPPSQSEVTRRIAAQRDLVQKALHALTGGSATEGRRITRQALRQSTPGTMEFGFLLHRFGDTYGHSMLGNEERLYPPEWGHALDFHAPDQIHRRPTLYKQYVLDLFRTLSALSGNPSRLTEEQVRDFAFQISSVRVTRPVTQLDRMAGHAQLNVAATESAQIQRIRGLSVRFMPGSEFDATIGPPTQEQALPVGHMRQYAPENQEAVPWNEHIRRMPFIGGIQNWNFRATVEPALHSAARKVGQDVNIPNLRFQRESMGSSWK